MQRAAGSSKKKAPPKPWLPYVDYPDAERRETYAEKSVPLECISHLGKVRYIQALAELPAHRHREAVEICLILRGNLDWEIEGRVYSLKPGEIFLTHPTELHGGCCSIMQPCELYFVQIRPDSCPSSSQAFLRAILQCPVRCFSGNSRLATIFENLLNECRQPQEDSRTLMELELATFLALIVRDSKDATRQKLRKLSAPVRRVVNYLAENPDAWPSASELAAIAGIGRSLLFEKFRRETGETLRRYIQQARIDRAKVLLGSGGRSITDVAMGLGFSSSQYFATVFRRQCGITPCDYIELTKHPEL